MVHQLKIIQRGVPLDQAEKVLIMIHGRGGNAEDITTISSYLHVDEFALLAPQATQNTWYPYSFIAPTEQNEPWLSSALDVVNQTVEKAIQAGIRLENIYFFGFSQGACLTVEYLARHARRYGGAFLVIGGLIGEQINRQNYQGNFEQTPILIVSSDPDFHVPVERVYATSNILREMNAQVKEEIFPEAGHQMTPIHMELANKFLWNHK